MAAMILQQVTFDKIRGEGLTYDDVLLIPGASSVMPRDVDTSALLRDRGFPVD